MLLCPDTTNSNGKELTMAGFKGQMKTSSIIYKVEKCHGEKHKCKDEDKINDYIRNMNIEMWIIHEQLDFRMQGVRPTTKRMEIIDSLS